MVTYRNGRPLIAYHRAQRAFLSPFGWYFVLGMVIASAMGVGLALAT